MISKEDSKSLIIENFHKNVIGGFPNDLKKIHKGYKGHWLESNLGGKIDADGNADLNGFECKIDSKKFSWGDWGASYRIFCDKSYDIFKTGNIKENMHKFVKKIGVVRNHLKHGTYYSLSGKHMVQYLNDSTSIGLSIEENNTDISVFYNFDKDQRESKILNIPKEFQKNNLLIYKWFGTDSNFQIFKESKKVKDRTIKINLKGKNASVSLEERIRRKFGVYGLVIGLHDKYKGFYGLKFLKRISFKDWLSFLKNKNVFYDTALTTSNDRPYNQWRSTKKFMDSLVEDIYIP